MAVKKSGGGGLFDLMGGSRSSRSTGIGEALAAEAREAQKAAVAIEGAMKKVGNAILSIQGGKGIEKYWDAQRASIENVINALNSFQRFESRLNAENLLKEINAFEAFNQEGKSILDFTDRLGDGFNELYAKAQKLGSGLDSAFTKNNLREYAEAYSMLKSAGINVDDFVHRIQEDESALRETNSRLERDLARTSAALEQAQSDLQEAMSGAMFENLQDELNRFKQTAEQAKEEFRGFLLSIGEDSNEVWNEDGGKFGRYFQQIEQGVLTANQAILQFREDTKFFGGEISGDSVTAFLAKFEEIASSIDVIRQAITELKTAFNFDGVANVPPIMRELSEGADQASESTRALINSASDVATLEGLVGALKSLIETSRDTAAGVDSAGAAVAQMLDSIAKLGNADAASLDNITRIMRSLASMNGMTVGKSASNNLVATIEALSGIPDTSKLLGLSSVNFHNFDDLHVSKASLRNMAEFLPVISAVDVNSLRSLADINWNNLNELNVSKSSVGALGDLANKVNNAVPSTSGSSGISVSVEVMPDEPSVQAAAEHINAELSQPVEVPVTAHIDTSSADAGVSVSSKIDWSHVLEIDTLADKYAEARKFITAIKKELKDFISNDHISSQQLENGYLKGFASSFNSLQKSFTSSKDIVAEMYNLYDKAFLDDAPSALLDKIDEIIARAKVLGEEVQKAKSSLEIVNVDVDKGTFGDSEAIAAEIDEAMSRAKSGIRGVVEETRNLSSEQGKVATEAGKVGDAVEASEAKVESAEKKIERVAERASQAFQFTFKFDETSLSSLSQTIQDAIQKASANIKLTIDNVELSASAQQKVADSAQKAASGGTDRSTRGSAKPAIEDETAAIEKNIDAWFRDQEAWREAQAEKERAAGWKAADAMAKEEAAQQKEIDKAKEAANAYYEKEEAARAAGEAAAEAAQKAADAHGGSGEGDDLENLIKLYIQLNEAERNYENARGRGDTTNMGRWSEISEGIQVAIDEIERAHPELIDLANEDERVIRSMEALGNAADSATKKLDDASLKRQTASAQEAEKALDDLQKKMSSLTLDNPKIGKLAGNEAFNADYSTALNEARAAIVALQNADTASRESAVANARQKVEALEGVITKYTNAARAARELDNASTQASKLADKIDIWTDKNPKAYKDAKAQVDEWLSTLRSETPIASEQIRKISTDFQHLSMQEKMAGNNGQTFFQTLKAGWSKFGGWSLVSRSFMSVIRIFKQAVTAVKEVDAAMTELRKVTDLTTAGYREFYEVATGMAGEVGAKLSDIINSTAD